VAEEVSPLPTLLLLEGIGVGRDLEQSTLLPRNRTSILEQHSNTAILRRWLNCILYRSVRRCWSQRLGREGRLPLMRTPSLCDLVFLLIQNLLAFVDMVLDIKSGNCLTRSVACIIDCSHSLLSLISAFFRRSGGGPHGQLLEGWFVFNATGTAIDLLCS